MKVSLTAILFCLIFTQQSKAQYEWQDPLDFEEVHLADKFGLFYNGFGIVLSGLLHNNRAQFEKYWESSYYLDYSREYHPVANRISMVSAKARFGKQLHKWVQMGGEAQLTNFSNSDVNATGFGAAIYFNWYFVNRPSFRLYFDNAYGIILTTKEFPEGGTPFNFTRYYGLSFSFQGKENRHWTFGVRTMHLSNAFLFGDDNNPAFDGVGIYLGINIKHPGKRNNVDS